MFGLQLYLGIIGSNTGTEGSAPYPSGSHPGTTTWVIHSTTYDGTTMRGYVVVEEVSKTPTYNAGSNDWTKALYIGDAPYVANFEYHRDVA